MNVFFLEYETLHNCTKMGILKEKPQPQLRKCPCMKWIDLWDFIFQQK